jgi:hypothetical protein
MAQVIGKASAASMASVNDGGCGKIGRKKFG